MDQVCQATNQVENDSEKLTLVLKPNVGEALCFGIVIVLCVIFLVVTVFEIIAKSVGRA